MLRVAALTGSLYLTSLQRAPRVVRGASLLTLIVLPTNPLASIICRVFYCLHLAITKAVPGDGAYLVAAVLGLRTWANVSSLTALVERGANVSECPPNANDNTNSISLLYGDSTDFQRLKCTCKARVCERFKQRSFLRSIIILTLVLLYCAASFLIYVRRSLHTYVYMAKHLLQGTPPGTHDAELYSNALETISSFDQVNAIWAISGMALSASALLLEISGWQFMWRGTKDESTQKEKVLSPQLLKLSYAEFVFSLILYVLFTWQSYIRLIPALTTGWGPLTVFWFAALTLYPIFLTYNWARGKYAGGTESNGAVVVILLWIFLVTQWPFQCTVTDIRHLVTCVSGGACPQPLFLWKDAWSDFLCIY